MFLSYTASRQMRFLSEQRSEPYGWYGKWSSAAQNRSWWLEVLSGKWLCRLAGKGGV